MRATTAWQDAAAAMSPETRLILACCRPLGDHARVSAIGMAAAAGFDPAALLVAARNHRVEGFVQEGLKAATIALPPPEAALLGDRVRRARLQLLRNTAEEVRVTRALRDAEIDVMSIKGATLAMLAQGSLALKSAWDVDLLIRPEARVDADAVLTALGYRHKILDGKRSAREVERYMVGVKEVVWRHPERETVIELHRALFDHRGRIAAIGLDSPRTAIDLPGAGSVETIAPGPLFAYLAVHGTHHGWMRLKWLTDVAGLLHGREDAVEDWYREAITAGAGRAPAIALLLAHRLLGIALPTLLRDEIELDRTIDCRAALAGQLIERMRSDHGEPLRLTLRAHLTVSTLSYRLEPGLRGWMGGLLVQLRKPNHPHHLKVPPALLPLLMLVWLPFRIISRLWR